MRAGLPITTACAGTERVTTAPAPTIAPAPMVRPGRMVALAPIEAPWRTTVLGKATRMLAAARKAVVGEGGVGADENVVLDAHARPRAGPRI